jgi:peptidoglycan/xylan/chitin deacetylase (PgdA/CDA1 family)
MQDTAAAGFEVGIHCWDHIRWQDGVGKANQNWTITEMDQAKQRFKELFGKQARTHGAAGWQMNANALRHLDDLKMDYASDCRGSHPFLPVVNGELFTCPQCPTTLPTLDELIGVDDITPVNVADHLLNLTRQKTNQSQVFTLHAELEGLKFLPQFEALLKGWINQGWKLVSLSELAESVRDEQLPRHQFLQGSLPGRSGTLSLQGPEFPPKYSSSLRTF